MVFKCLFRGCKKYLLGKVSTCIARGVSRQALLYQYLLGKVSTTMRVSTKYFNAYAMYQYLLGKVSTTAHGTTGGANYGINIY